MLGGSRFKSEEKMLYSQLYLNDPQNLIQSYTLTYMILDHNVTRIVYLWREHTCEYVPHFRNTEWLKFHGIAVVYLPFNKYQEVFNLLNGLRYFLALNGQFLGPYGLLREMKSSTNRIYQCLCA